MKATADRLWNSFDEAGDGKSFKALFETWFEPLCRYACFFTRDSMDAEEVVLDFFLHLWRKRETTEIEKSFESYAKSAVHNRCLNKLRSRRNYEDIEKAADASVEEIYEFDTDTLMDIAWAAASSMPDKCRDIFNMSRRDGLSYAQIAEKTGLEVKTVEWYMTRALKYMRVAVKKMYILLLIF